MYALVSHRVNYISEFIKTFRRKSDWMIDIILYFLSNLHNLRVSKLSIFPEERIVTNLRKKIKWHHQKTSLNEDQTLKLIIRMLKISVKSSTFSDVLIHFHNISQSDWHRHETHGFELGFISQSSQMYPTIFIKPSKF